MTNTKTSKTYLALFIFISMLCMGCPIGLQYPVAPINSEKTDKELLGTWVADSDSAEVQEVLFEEINDVMYSIKVLRKSEDYMADAMEYLGWVTKLDGNHILYAQPYDVPAEEYYHYHYALKGKSLVIHDMSLLVGGKDAVTSTEALRSELSASLKKPDCLSSRFTYQRKK